MCQRLPPYVPQVSLLVVGMVTPNSMQFVTREAARIDGFMSAAGDALFQTGFVDPIVAAAYTTGSYTEVNAQGGGYHTVGGPTGAAATAAVAASIVDVGWHQRTATDIGALWDGNQVRLQSLGYLPPTISLALVLALALALAQAQALALTLTLTRNQVPATSPGGGR